MNLLPWRWTRRKVTLTTPKDEPVDRDAARRERIARREANDDLARDPSMLLTTQTFPVYYLPITKCGCTFLKNLFYALDHGDEHPDGVHIHEQEEGLIHAAGQPFAQVYDSPYAFTVLRDPAERFMSFYFDKIWGEGSTNFPKIRAHLEQTEIVDLTRALSVEEHRVNAWRLLDWVRLNLEGETDLNVNYHWRPQTSRLRRARMFALNHLTLEGLDWQLPMLMAPVIPDMAERMQAVKSRNRSEKPVTVHDVMDDELAAAIRKLYRADTILHERARRAWAGQAEERRQGELPAPPFLRHRRVERVQVAAQTSLTGAALCGVREVAALIGTPTEQYDLLLNDFDEQGVRALALMRDPVERFGALYDLMMRFPRRSGFAPVRKVLTQRRGLIAQPEGTEDHATNLTILSTFMRRRKPEYIDMQGFARSRMQSYELRRVIASGGLPIFTDRLGVDLPPMLDRPDLAEPLTAISTACRLPEDIATALTGPVAEAVQTLYRPDCDLYDSMRSATGLPVSGDWT